MKKSILPILILLSLFCSFSCTSKPVPIPGDSAKVIRNIYVEYMNIANTYLKLEEYKSAAEYYKLAMQNRKLYWACYYKLALCYVYSSDWINAEPMYQAMLKRDPENSTLKASLAYIYSMNGRVGKAVKIYQELLASQPDNESFLENYLIITLSDKRYFKKYRTSVDEAYSKMNETYPENSQLKKITEKYKELAGIKDEEIEDVDDSEESEDLENAENTDGSETSDNSELESSKASE
jgi:tetratricopeptide (TPR) repeat protein